jgi:hypothetical protein
MKVKILSGSFTGFIGRLSYDEDGTEWVTFYDSTMGFWRDIQANYAPVNE